MSVQDLIHQAFQKLSQQQGYVRRSAQEQLALLLGDFAEGGMSGAIEAPTGLGKSLAALVPMIANAIVHQKRCVISTYTNILAEQYWRKDLPLALSLFEDADTITTQYLIGRQRYVCLNAIDDLLPELGGPFRRTDMLGVESDFLNLSGLPAKNAREAWPKVSVPTVCGARACPSYNQCFYYAARKRAETAHLVITNHSVVIQDAILSSASADGKGMLGKFDYLVLDEAHDLHAAAMASFEFELSGAKLNVLMGVAGRIERELADVASRNRRMGQWVELFEEFRKEIDGVRRKLVAMRLEAPQSGILAISPVEIEQHPSLKPRLSEVSKSVSEDVAEAAAVAIDLFLSGLHREKEIWESMPSNLNEPLQNYTMYMREFAESCRRLMLPAGVSVSFNAYGATDSLIRLDTVNVDEPLKEMLWERTPAACMSATLAVDRQFEFFRRTVGFPESYEEILESPFDFPTQTSLYLPPPGTIPDPSIARKEGREEEYFWAIARQLESMIQQMKGRTLALFHSRREMEAVYALMPKLPGLPLYVQPRGGQAASVGDRFKALPAASLFALRSFWTGFDAPGDTLSCVVVVRVPFEVPVEPSALVRMAHLHRQGLDPFASFTLPMAKMMVRQGVGRLMRRDGDRGVIALLDPRIQTKPYGADILENLPEGIRTFSDFTEAMAWVGLE